MPDLSMFQRRAAWAFDRRAQAEHDATAIIATLSQFGITALQQEVWYGMRAQGDIDGLTPTTPDAMGVEAGIFAAAGIAWIPVVVPRGLIGEAELHAQAARVAGAIVVDIETGGDYWPAATSRLVRVYARALREACGPDVAIAWQPDGRLIDPDRGDWDDYAGSCVPYVDAWCPQLYAGWGIYGKGTATVAADIRRYEAFAALGPTFPTLYLADSLAEPAGVWEGARSLGSTGFCAFRFGAMDGRALSVVRDMTLPPVPKPVPEPVPVPDFGAYLDEFFQWQNDDIANITDRTAARKERLAAIRAALRTGG